MKKKILCAVFVASSICMNVFAADVSLVDNKVTVEVDSVAEAWGTLIVTKEGASLADDENIIAMKQAKADENGKATFNFSMPATLEGGVNGKYDLHIKSGDGDVYIESMYYALPADRTSVAGNLKTEANVKAIIENGSNEDTLRTLGVHLDIYNVSTVPCISVKECIVITSILIIRRSQYIVLTEVNKVYTACICKQIYL